MPAMEAPHGLKSVKSLRRPCRCHVAPESTAMLIMCGGCGACVVVCRFATAE